MKSLQTRATGASCKECRRLKIKCDKQVPCGTCTKRGLQSLCPDGQLSGTKGSRYVLASAEESWHRIQALCVRVQDLEFALDRAHSLVTTDKHPLLETELVKIGQDPRAVKPESNSPPKAAEDVPSVSNFGTMKISKSGAFRWLGTTALPVLMLDDYDGDSDSKTRAEEGVPKQESGQSTSPPRELNLVSELKSAAIRLLPDREEALRLIDIYFDFSWRWPLIVCRSIVMDSLFLPAYDGDATSVSTWNLSALYSILALGTLFDMNMEPECQEYKTRRHWANKLFYLHLPKGPSTVDGIEALVLLFRLSWPFLDKSYSDNYELIAWGIKLCEKIGLHRDPAHLNLSTDECLRRRRVFWAIWFHDSFSSMVLGQPPTLAKGFVDCRPPQETTEAADDPHVQITLIAQDILSHFLEPGHHSSYSTVLLIDQKIRQVDHDLGAAYLRSIVTGFGRPVSNVTAGLMKGYVRGICNGLLVSLHKTYFSYALLRPGEDPSSGPWSASVNTVFESSSAMLEAAANITKFMPALHSRVAPNWIHYHGAVMSLYGICIYTPYSPRADEAMKRADTAIVEIFQPHVKDSEQAAASLPSLLACQSKARASLAAYQAGTWIHPAQNPSTPTFNEPFMNTDVFFNHKVAIAGAFSQMGQRQMVSHSHRSSLSDFGEVLKADALREPRRIVSMDAFHPSTSHYDEAYFRPSNAGGDSQSIYAGSSSSSSSVIVQDSNAYWSSHPTQSPVQQHPHPHDERYAYTRTSMDWSTSPVPAHVKVESPPNSTIIWSEQQYGQQLVPPGAAASHLHMLQTPDEYGLTPAPAGPVRRLRGLSRARSFPSDNPHVHPGYSSTIIPPMPSLAPLHTHGHGLHSMNIPSHYLSPQTPSSAHISQGQGVPSPTHGQQLDSTQSPISPHLHHPSHPYPQQHSYTLAPTVSYSPEERQWTEATYR